MTASNAKERLSRLVELASQSRDEARHTLADELADLLLSWPANYPANMREPFEALLEKAVRALDRPSCSMLANRLIGAVETPLTILNLLIFDATLETKRAILLRNALRADVAAQCPPPQFDERFVISAARGVQPAELADLLAQQFRIGHEIAAQLFDDDSGFCLATLCKGMGTSRALFSVLATLSEQTHAEDGIYARLSVFEDISREGAEALVAFWRGQSATEVVAAVAA